MSFRESLPLTRRTSGLLLHPSSLPGPHGIGDLGPSAHEFVDFLAESGQSLWQMFPLGPLSWGNSPYQTLSAFAASHLLISLVPLVKKGWLPKSRLNSPDHLHEDKVLYNEVFQFKQDCLKQAYESYIQNASKKEKGAFSKFCSFHKDWLENFSLYSAIKNHHHGAPWWQWELDIRKRKPKSLQIFRKGHEREIEFTKFCQWQFHTQWNELHSYAQSKGIHLIGDIPIFVAHDSADVWAHPELFSVGKDGHLDQVAGVPPDYFSKTGQLWGNPVYHWNVLKKKGYKWWIQRLKKSLSMFDIIRLDHFIGFHRYWSVPGDAGTAEPGAWKKGPGADFFKVALKKIPHAQIIAEDLGSVTPEVIELRKKFGFPGMRVLQFAFETHQGAEVNRPYNFTQNSVVYTGTHDNDTTVGWFNNLSPNGTGERANVLNYTNSDGKEIHWDLIRVAMMSRANTVIFPLQDILGLGSEARINRPGSTEGNWEWRVSKSALTPAVAKRLRDLSELYDRV